MLVLKNQLTPLPLQESKKCTALYIENYAGLREV